MIRWYRIWAVVRRHLLTYARGLDKINTLFYWPLINIGIFGLTAYTASNDNAAIVAQVLAGAGAWQIMLRVALESATLVYQEVASENIVNLLATPLTFTEWVAAGALLGFFALIVVSCTCIFGIYFLFGVKLWTIGLLWLPILLLLLFAGLIFTYLISGFFMLMGLRAIDVMFSIVWVFVPFSGAYAPLALLPGFVQKIAAFLPFCYIFGPLRNYQITGIVDLQSLTIAVVLTLFYLGLSIAFFKMCFNRSKQLGIARLS